ncbi:hypothetical protein FXV91_17650 [Methanosarcina sp. DH2]|jgi:hypothetical protein|nr:hypothetical protein [Methanosarcina sp. DH2]
MDKIRVTVFPDKKEKLFKFQKEINIKKDKERKEWPKVWSENLKKTKNRKKTKNQKKKGY